MNRRRFACAARVGLMLVVPSVVPSSGVSLAQAQSVGGASEPDGQAGSAVIEFPKIDRRPGPAKWKRPPMTTLPVFDLSQALQNPWQLDLRQRDASGLVVPHRLADLLQASFDDGTKWPPATALPEGFDAAQIMELAKNPGLGVRKLHQAGITGRGVGIAIIDQALLVEHQEYADRLRLYEETDDIALLAAMSFLQKNLRTAPMHGPAVASFAVGKTVGVAPEADLYYIATARGGGGKDFTYLARCIRRVLAVNRQLPAKRKIRVIAMAIGWDPRSRGYQEVTAAAQEAKEAGMLVVCSSIAEVHGLRFNGLGRSPLADPDVAGSYEPGSWWAEQFRVGRRRPRNALLVPMDSRTAASPHSASEYVFYRHGGWSWSIPYIAGLYALAVQTDPAITPERFWDLALATGDTIRVPGSEGDVALGPIVNAPALIKAVRSSAKPSP